MISIERRMAMDVYVCLICGNVYSPTEGDPDNGIAPGTPYEALPESYCCARCGAEKEMLKHK